MQVLEFYGFACLQVSHLEIESEDRSSSCPVVRYSDRYCQHIAKALSEHVNEWWLVESKARLFQDCLVEAVSGKQQGNNGH